MSYCGDNYNPSSGEYYGCNDGYNYSYGSCCERAQSVWVNILIWSSAFLLCCLCCSLLFGGMHRRRRRFRQRQAEYRHYEEDSFDSYYDEVPRQRPPPQQTRVVYVQQQASPNRRDSDTVRTYTTAAQGQAPPLPFGMRPLVDTTKARTTIRITLYTG